MNEPKMIGDHINEMLTKSAVTADKEPMHEYIRKVRKFLGLSQVLIGSLAEITPAHLSEFETKDRPITRAQKAKLKSIFGLGVKAKAPTGGSFLKKCKSCNHEKPHDAFYSGKKPDGTLAFQFQECKKCSNARSARNRAKRRESDKQVLAWMAAGETVQQRKSAP